MARQEWETGQQAALARACGVTTVHMNGVIHGKGCSVTLAKKLSEEARKLGLTITRMDVLYPVESSNPLITTRQRDNKITYYRPKRKF